MGEQTKAMLSPVQRLFYDEVMSAISNGNGGCFFLSASGGTGKTFTINGLLAATRVLNGERNVALAVASTGIAATLLSHGRTFHSRFKVLYNMW